MVDTDFSQSPTIMRGVKVTNVGDEDFTDSYANHKYTIKAGSDTFVPFDAACLWLGDPRTQDLGPRDKHRSDEFHRIAFRMGALEADREDFERVRPKLKVFSQDGQTEYRMVADDPDGPGQNVFEAEGDIDGDPQARVAALERVVQQLMAERDDKAKEGGDLAELGIGDPTNPADPSKAQSIPSGGGKPTVKPATSNSGPPVDSPDSLPGKVT